MMPSARRPVELSPIDALDQEVTLFLARHRTRAALKRLKHLQRLVCADDVVRVCQALTSADLATSGEMLTEVLNTAMTNNRLEPAQKQAIAIALQKHNFHHPCFGNAVATTTKSPKGQKTIHMPTPNGTPSRYTVDAEARTYT